MEKAMSCFAAKYDVAKKKTGDFPGLSAAALLSRAGRIAR
jgi:hypothetical protein